MIERVILKSNDFGDDERIVVGRIDTKRAMDERAGFQCFTKACGSTRSVPANVIRK